MATTDLIAGPYHPPACRKGDWLVDELDGLTEVGGWTDAPIAWPRRKKTGRPSLILTSELARAVRTESVEAIRYWWGVGPTKVWQWRQALGVDTTPGSQRIARRGVPAEAAAKGRQHAAQPDARIRMADAKRGQRMSTAARKAISLAAARPRTFMTADDLRQWRYTLQLNAEDAADMLGLSKTSIQWLEIERRPIKHYIALACSALYMHPHCTPPTSIAEWRARMGWTLEMTAIALGLTGGPTSIWVMERRESNGKPIAHGYLLALFAIEHGILPWHRLRRAHRLAVRAPLKRGRHGT